MNNIYGGVVEQDCLTLHVNQKQMSASDSDVTPSDSNACNLALAIEKSFNNFSALCDQDLQYVGWRMIIASMRTQSSTYNLNVVYFDERICIAEDNSRSTLLCLKDVEAVESSCKLDVVELNLPEYIKGLSCTDKSLYFYTGTICCCLQTFSTSFQTWWKARYPQFNLFCTSSVGQFCVRN